MEHFFLVSLLHDKYVNNSAEDSSSVDFIISSVDQKIIRDLWKACCHVQKACH